MGKQKKKGRVILSAAKAKQIRALYAKGHSQRKLAAKYGVARSTIFGVTSGKTWK